MSNLISGKDALIALANDQEIEYFDSELGEWVYMDMNHHFKRNFRLKPKTIMLNGIEVPAPFEPKDGDYVYVISDQAENGWIKTKHDYDFGYVFGAWRTEDEIKQVVEALRNIFKGVK